MTRADLIERVAFWQAGLMDVDHLRDVAYEAMDSAFDCQEFRLIAGDAKLDNDDARDLLARAFHSFGMVLPAPAEAERIVAASVARSILAGAIEPIWGAGLISRFGQGHGVKREELPSKVWGPLEGYSCHCCNGLDSIVAPTARASRREELRVKVRRHLEEVLPRIEEWAGLSARGRLGEPGFMGWRCPLEAGGTASLPIDTRIRELLLGTWDPIGIRHHDFPKDEYDCCLPGIRRLLLSAAPTKDLEKQLSTYLREQEVQHMGLEDDERSSRRRQVLVEELIALRSSL